MLLFFSKWSFLGTFAFILLLPKFLLSNYGLRPEDLLSFIILLLVPFLVVKLSRLIHPGLMVSIILYFIYITVISCLKYPEYIDKIFILIFKELSYFGYFLVTFFIVIRYPLKDISKIFLIIFIFSLPALFYMFYQFNFGIQGMYGVTFYGHSKSPASSGLISLMLCYLSYIYFVFFKNKLVLFYCIIWAVIVLFGGSKLAAVGLLSFASLSVLSELNKEKMLYGIFFLVLLFSGLLVSIKSGIGALHRLETIFSPLQTILDRGIWYKFQWIDGFHGYIFGAGVAKGHTPSDIYISETASLEYLQYLEASKIGFSLGMAMDNQFLYFLIVLGLFGSIIFFFILFFLVLSHPKKSYQRRIQMVLIFSYLAMGMGAEVFQLSISGITFWVISGFLAGYSKKTEAPNKYDLSLHV